MRSKQKSLGPFTIISTIIFLPGLECNVISGALAAISGREATLRMDTTSPGKKWVPDDTLRLPYMLWSPYLISTLVSGMLSAAKHNCQHSSQ